MNFLIKTGDYKQPDYIETNNFTSNFRIGEPKFLAMKQQKPNYLDFAHIFVARITMGYFTGNDLDSIDIDNIFDDDKIVI